MLLERRSGPLNKAPACTRCPQGVVHRDIKGANILTTKDVSGTCTPVDTQLQRCTNACRPLLLLPPPEPLVFAALTRMGMRIAGLGRSCQIGETEAKLTRNMRINTYTHKVLPSWRTPEWLPS